MEVGDSALTASLRRAICALCAAFAAFAAFGQTEGDHAVFAHYMTCFSKDIDSYKKEIQIAQMYGVEGWALNCGNWQRRDPKTGEWKPYEKYMQSSSNVFEAAHQLGTGFRLFFSPDGSLEGTKINNHVDMGVRYHDHPNLFRYDGRPVISGWAAGNRETTKYPYMKAEYERLGVGDYFMIPSLGCSGYTMFETVDLLDSDMYGATNYVCDGTFFFGCDNSVKEFVSRLANWRFAAMRAGKAFMAGPCPAYNSSNLRDYRGVQGYCEMWRGIVRDQPELVEIVTWNDNSEDSGIYMDGWTGRTLPHDLQNRWWACRDESFLDLTAYFAAAYKDRGIYPAIVQDKAYVVYRPRPKSMTKLYSPETDTWTDYRDSFLQIHDDVQDCVYVTVALTAPARVAVRQGLGLFGGKTAERDCPAGFTTLEVPMVPGETPEVTVERGGRTLLKFFGRRQIAAKETKRNSAAYDSNGTHRQWTACAVAGEPIAVFEPSADGSCEWKLPADVAPGSYSFRIRYVNGSDEEARYTFYVDLPWLPEESRKHHLPLYLPPTGGAEKEVDFLWSVLPGASSVRIVADRTTGKETRWVKDENGSRRVPLVYDWSDWGGAEIKSVAVVRNVVAKRAPAPRQPYPEMVAIPGGTFTMGAKAVEIDEGAPREVTVSPFLIGKYEVTNREYEQFRPQHRAKRTLVSWRDDEPVVYVSWKDAAAYCNFLSAREGLAPAYDESKGMERVEGASGYRLPTEAEWEYVATGRGENRTYPWGEEPPFEMCNSARPDDVFQSADLHRNKTANRAVCAGSYATDVSRDGVFDMGGNVLEWCNDNYHYDAAQQGGDPCDVRPPKSGRTNYRSIRGGGFGYYGISHRCCDREYNNPGYPGYVYIGFRVARPAGEAKTYNKGVQK